MQPLIQFRLLAKEIIAPYYRVKLDWFPFVLNWNNETNQNKVVHPVNFLQSPEVGQIYDVEDPVIEFELLTVDKHIELLNPIPGKICEVNDKFLNCPNEKDWLYVINSFHLTHFK